MEDEELNLISLTESLKHGIAKTKKYLSTHKISNKQLAIAKSANLLFVDKTINELTEDQDIYPLDEMDEKLLFLKETKQEIEQMFDSYIT